MDKYTLQGAKKLFSLTKTKLRLAEEAGTVEARPAPLPLPKLFAHLELNTVEDCRTHRQRLKDGFDLSNDAAVAATVLQLADIIECVKYRFEPKEYMPLFGAEEFRRLEEECMVAGKPVTILIMAPDAAPYSVFVGEDPPPGVRHYSRVISGVAPLLHHVYASNYFSDGTKLKNIAVRHGSRTLLGNAVESALQTYLTT